MPRKEVTQSYLEKRLGDLYEADPNNPSYHLGKNFDIDGDGIDTKLLAAVLNMMARHNPNLRAVYENKKKYIVDTNFKPITVEEITYHSEEEKIALIKKYTTEPFKLNQFPLFKMLVLKDKNGKQTKLITKISHMIADGVAAFKKYKKVEAHYNARAFLCKLPFIGRSQRLTKWAAETLAKIVHSKKPEQIAKKIPDTKATRWMKKYWKHWDYNDFAKRQRTDLKDDTHPAKHHYDKLVKTARMEFRPAAYKLPKDKEKQSQVNTHSVTLDDDTVRALKALCKTYGAQMPSLISSIFHLTLYQQNTLKTQPLVRSLLKNIDDNNLTLGYHAVDVASHIKLNKQMTFEDLLNAVRTDFKQQRQRDEKGRCVHDLPASYFLNKAKKPFKVEVNYSESSFNLGIPGVKKGTGDLQEKAVEHTWYGENNYEVELSAWVNNDKGKFTLQMFTAKRCYDQKYTEQFAKNMIDNIKRLYLDSKNKQRKTLSDIANIELKPNFKVPTPKPSFWTPKRKAAVLVGATLVAGGSLAYHRARRRRMQKATPKLTTPRR